MRRGRENDRDKNGKARSHWNVEEINFPVEIFQNAIFALFDGSFGERLFVNKDVSDSGSCRDWKGNVTRCKRFDNQTVARSGKDGKLFIRTGIANSPNS